MKVLVPVKRVVDLNVKVRVKSTVAGANRQPEDEHEPSTRSPWKRLCG